MVDFRKILKVQFLEVGVEGQENKKVGWGQSVIICQIGNFQKSNEQVFKKIKGNAKGIVKVELETKSKVSAKV